MQPQDEVSPAVARLDLPKTPRIPMVWDFQQKLLMEKEIPRPTTWDIQNLGNNGIRINY